MAQPFEQDIILDADGRPLFSAFQYVEREVAKLRAQINAIGRDSYKNVGDVGKVIQQQTRDLQNALAQMRMLTSPGSRAGDFEAALRSRGRETKTLMAAEARERARVEREAQRAINAESRAGQRDWERINAERTRLEAEGLRTRHRNRVEAAQAEARDSARQIRSLDELNRARAENIEKLRRYRDAARLERNPEQARALADLIRLERARGTALEATNRSLQQQESMAQRRLQGLNTQSARALIPGDIRDQWNADPAGRGALRLGLQFEQERARQRLIAATTEEERRTALANLDIANRRVAAINQLHNAEERVLATERRIANTDLTGSHRARMALSRQYGENLVRQLGGEQAIARAKQEQVRAEEALAVATRATRAEAQRNLQVANSRLRATAAAAREEQGQKTPLQNILSPGYATAAFARTSVYGAAAMAAYGAFNTVQQSLAGIIQLEDEMARLQAISNSTDGQMQQLKGSILEIGGASRFSLVDLTKIAQTLAQAGVTAGQMEEVLRSVTTLATASGSTPDEAVQLVTSALGAFQLQASEAARVADLMTTALNRTKLTVQQTGQAIQYVGATAFEQNISLEQMLATVGAIAQAGVRSGSTIGTGFRQFLVDLQNPSKALTEQLTQLGLSAADVDVTVRGLPAVLDTLRQSGFGAAQAYAGLELRAAAFYLTARNNVDVMDQLQLGFANSGAAALANERAMNSVSAQWQRFKNLLTEGFDDSMGEMMTVLKNLLIQISDRIIEMQNAAAAIEARQAKGRAGYDSGVGGTLKYVSEYDLRPHMEDFLETTLNWALPKTSSEGGFGTWLRDLGRDMDATTEESARLGQQVNETSEAVEQQRGKISELDQELLRLIVQKESLRNNDARSAAEIATLTSRFQGLAAHLVNTGNRYDDLTNAVRRYRQEQLRVLGMDLTAQASTLELQTAEARRTGGAAVRRVQADQATMNVLNPTERAALNSLMTSGIGSPEFARAQGVIGDAVRRFAESQPAIARSLNNIVQQAGTISTNTAQLGSISTALAQNRAASTPYGQQITDQVRHVESLITQLGSQTNGTGKKDELTKTANNTLNVLERSINDKLKTNLNPSSRSFLQGALTDLTGLRQQVRALNAETADERRAREKAQREADRPEKSRLVTQEDVDAVGRELGLQLGSGRRSKEEQNRLHARGVTPATGETSSHSNGGSARDFDVAGLSDREAELKASALRAAYKARGIDAYVKYERGGKNDGTGRHIHASVRKGTRISGAGDGGGEDAALRQDITTNKLALNTAEDELRVRLREMANASSQDVFDAAHENAKKALDEWEQRLRTVTAEELAASGALPNESADRLREMENQIRVQREDFTSNIAQRVEKFQREVFTRLMKNLDNALNAAQTRFEAALQPSLNRVSAAQATLTGFGYESNQGNIPDYVQQLAQTRLGQAEESAVRVRSAALPALITERERALRNAQLSLTTMDTSKLNPEEVDAAQNKVAALTQELANLRQEKLNLDLALSAGGLVPSTISEGLNQAVAAWREANHVGRSFSDEIIMNLGGAIETIHSGLTEMFTSIMDGSQSALQAFANFAKGIMNYIVQIVAKIVATKIIEALFNIAGGAYNGGTPTESSMGAVDIGGGATAMFNGGFNPGVPGYANGGRGGQVMNGSSAADSVNAKIAKNEWVVRSKAVQSVGHRFMAQLNQHGSKALDQLQAMPQVNVKPVTDLKVYMVKPDERPQLGPNDVLLTWQQDVLSGGESRKLIQHVVREG